MASETLEEIVEQETINQTYKSRALTLLAKHPMTPLVNRRVLRWNIASVLFTFILLTFSIICGRIASRNCSLKNPHTLYSQIGFAFSGALTNQILQSLNATGLLALGAQNGVEIAKSVMFAVLIMLLLLSVAKRLQSDKRCHISRNNLFTKFNKAVITAGFVLAWLVMIPCILYSVSNWLIFAQMISGGTDALSVLTGIFLLIFYIMAIGVSGFYVITAGIYCLILMLISKRRGYYYKSSPNH